MSFIALVFLSSASASASFALGERSIKKKKVLPFIVFHLLALRNFGVCYCTSSPIYINRWSSKNKGETIFISFTIFAIGEPPSSLSTGRREKQIGVALTAPVVLQWKTLTAMRLEVNRNSRAETIFMRIYKNTGLRSTVELVSSWNLVSDWLPLFPHNAFFFSFFHCVHWFYFYLFTSFFISPPFFDNNPWNCAPYPKMTSNWVQKPA